MKSVFFTNNVSVFIFRYATEVDVDFVRKSVRAIGRCAIKVEVSELFSSVNLVENVVSKGITLSQSQGTQVPNQ